MAVVRLFRARRCTQVLVRGVDGAGGQRGGQGRGEEAAAVEFGGDAPTAPAQDVTMRNVGHGDAVPLTDLRARMEADPNWLTQ